MIISGKELKEKGLTYYKINQLVEEGILRKLNKRYYENMNYTGETTGKYMIILSQGRKS